MYASLWSTHMHLHIHRHIHVLIMHRPTHNSPARGFEGRGSAVIRLGVRIGPDDSIVTPKREHLYNAARFAVEIQPP